MWYIFHQCSRLYQCHHHDGKTELSLFKSDLIELKFTIVLFGISFLNMALMIFFNFFYRSLAIYMTTVSRAQFCTLSKMNKLHVFFSDLRINFYLQY
jgi:hypothetical protein